MVLREGVSVLARVVGESRLWSLTRELRLQFGRGRVVGLFERALAVPAVARMVLVPKRVGHGQRELALPEGAVAALGRGRRGGHPTEVGHDIGIADKLLPVGGVVGTNDSRVVFGAEPRADIMGRYTFYIVSPLAEGF